jgi:cytochrome c peroxidase
LLPTLDSLVDEVLRKRMQLQTQPSEDQIAELGVFLDSIPAPSGVDGLDAPAIARGSALFHSDDTRCAACHEGPEFTDNALNDVGTGGRFETPTLLGVGLRSPLMHDGCAKTLRDRFGLCGGGDQHGHTSQLGAAEIADLVAFLQSL